MGVGARFDPRVIAVPVGVVGDLLDELVSALAKSAKGGEGDRLEVDVQDPARWRVAEEPAASEPEALGCAACCVPASGVPTSSEAPPRRRSGSWTAGRSPMGSRGSLQAAVSADDTGLIVLQSGEWQLLTPQPQHQCPPTHNEAVHRARYRARYRYRAGACTV